MKTITTCLCTPFLWSVMKASGHEAAMVIFPSTFAFKLLVSLGCCRDQSYDRHVGELPSNRVRLPAHTLQSMFPVTDPKDSETGRLWQKQLLGLANVYWKKLYLTPILDSDCMLPQNCPT